MNIPVFIIGFFIFLFCLYAFSNDDFVLLRKNITLTQVFNIAFITSLVGIFFSRFFYVLFHFSPTFLNPFVFFVFPYFTGLSQGGGVLGSMIFMILYFKSKKLPFARVFDFFSLSFLCSLWVFFSIQQIILLVEKKPVDPVAFIYPIIYLILFLVFVWFFVREKLRDGTAGLVTLIVFSFVSLFQNLMTRVGKASLVTPEDIIYIFLFLSSLILLIKEERFFISPYRSRR